MQNFILLAVSALVSLSAATVVVSAGDACGTVTTSSIATTAGVCYSVVEGTWHSARGCSSNHWLRIHSEADCVGTTTEADAGNCVTLGASVPILSFKCVDEL
jgi:hypothetical protein